MCFLLFQLKHNLRIHRWKCTHLFIGLILLNMNYHILN